MKNLRHLIALDRKWNLIDQIKLTARCMLPSCRQVFSPHSVTLFDFSHAFNKRDLNKTDFYDCFDVYYRSLS